MRNFRNLIVLSALLAIGIAACGGSAGSSTDAPATSISETTEITVEPTSTTATTTTTHPTTTTTTTTTTTEPTTTTTMQPETGSLENPLPVGDPSVSGFTYSESGTEWEGAITGLVETSTSRFNDEEGRCIVLLGTLTPTSIEDGAVSNSFNVPQMSLIANGNLIDSDVNECDVNDIEAAGYGWRLNAEVTVGTTYPFYAEFFLPGAEPAEPEVIVLGRPTGNQSLFYEPTILDNIPAP